MLMFLIGVDYKDEDLIQWLGVVTLKGRYINLRNESIASLAPVTTQTSFLQMFT